MTTHTIHCNFMLMLIVVKFFLVLRFFFFSQFSFMVSRLVNLPFIIILNQFFYLLPNQCLRLSPLITITIIPDSKLEIQHLSTRSLIKWYITQ